MASHTEGVVLKLVIDELEQIPVRGAERRASMQRMIDVLDEMSQYKSYESGRYRHLEDAMEMVKFYRGKRAQGAVHGRPVSAVIDLEPGYKLPAQTKEQPHGREKKKPTKVLSQVEVDDLQFTETTLLKKKQGKKLRRFTDAEIAYHNRKRGSSKR